ncbi:chitin binding peritrophin-A domain-containing protein [Streptomyces sp. NBC_00237]
MCAPRARGFTHTFYHCDYGQPLLRECPADLHSDPNRLVCDYPYRVPQ